MVQQIKNYKLVLEKNKLSGVSLFLKMECWQSFVGSKVRHRGQELLNNTILREKKMFKNEYCLELMISRALRLFYGIGQVFKSLVCADFSRGSCSSRLKSFSGKDRHILKRYHGVGEISRRVVGN